MTDPEEPLEVYEADGRPTGVAKARGAVHRDGDWHLAFFCWIFRHGPNGAEVVLQQRAETKDVWPGRFDASAAGHVRFGETTAEAAREIEEELGLRIDVGELEPVMRHRQEHVHDSGLVDREIHDVHVLRCELPLEDYRPGPEVTGVVAVLIDAVVELVEGAHARESIETVLFPSGRRIVLRAGDLVPYDLAYWKAIAHSGRASIARR
jgi:isopentenyldiphosphate isomerase